MWHQKISDNGETMKKTKLYQNSLKSSLKKRPCAPSFSNSSLCQPANIMAVNADTTQLHRGPLDACGLYTVYTAESHN